MNEPITLLTYSSVSSKDSNNRGFTLIELMVVIAIIAILAAIALPSYRRYVVANAERETQAKMLQLQVQLEQWRARALSYQGFKPQKVSSVNVVTYGYDDGATNKTIYVPNGSTASNYRYKITLVDSTTITDPNDGTVATSSLVTSGTAIDNATGRAWKMFAEPSSNYSTAHKMLLGSAGLQCQTKNNDSSITVASNDCGTYSEDW
ncbi:type IV pilin protein [Psychrobacter glacincola]|uniref:Type IV pilin protein n=1 Tax=Psychrobacter glacincola TaxID=56810 RepID=A0ABW1W3I7_9GAMM|nr:prepilin-type N-terminal cleavage/methylation domain-containing protein [Psychrobacter glacincola]